MHKGTPCSARAYTGFMSTPVQIRLPDDVAAELDAVVTAGAFESRTAALVFATRVMLARMHELELAERERRAYAEHPFPAPDEEWVLAPGRGVGQVT